MLTVGSLFAGIGGAPGPAGPAAWRADLDAMTKQRDVLRAALEELRINANRLCDRDLGGTYEDDCRRSIAEADAALAATSPATSGGLAGFFC